MKLLPFERSHVCLWNATHTFSIAYITLTKKIWNKKLWHNSFLLAYSKELSKWRRMAFIFLVIALLIAKLFKVLIYSSKRTCGFNVASKWCKITKNAISLKTFSVWNLTFNFVQCHDMSTVTFPRQQNGLQSLSIQRVKSEFPSFKNCHFLLLLIQWVWVNIWTFHSRSIRKFVRLWSNKWDIFHFGRVEVW